MQALRRLKRHHRPKAVRYLSISLLIVWLAAITPAISQTCKQKLDIIFLLDNSTSISSSEYRNMQQAAQEIAAAFLTSPEQDNRVAITQFGSPTLCLFGCGVSMDLSVPFTSDLATAQGFNRALSGGTYIWQAAEWLEQNLTNEGLKPREDAELIIFLMSDYQTSDPSGPGAGIRKPDDPYGPYNALKSEPWNATFVVQGFKGVPTDQFAAVASPGGSYNGPKEANSGDPEGDSLPRRLVLSPNAQSLIDQTDTVVDDLSQCGGVGTLGYDYGDAPLGYGTLGDNPVRHQVLLKNDVPSLVLGQNVTTESQGNPSSFAVGDNDDGVTFLDALVEGTSALIEIETLGEGYVQAWFDWNQDGDFEDEDEHSIKDRLLTEGITQLCLAVPEGYADSTIFSRFRLSTGQELSPYGPAPDGEVEDYAERYLPLSTLEESYEGEPECPDGTSNASSTTSSTGSTGSFDNVGTTSGNTNASSGGTGSTDTGNSSTGNTSSGLNSTSSGASSTSTTGGSSSTGNSTGSTTTTSSGSTTGGTSDYDLAVTIERHSSYAVRDRPVTYALNVENVGDKAFTEPLRLTLELPAELRLPEGNVLLAGADASHWRCDARAQIMTCNTEQSLEANAYTQFTFTTHIQPTEAQTLTLKANLTSSDPNPDNNAYTHTDSVFTVRVVPFF